MVTAETAIVLPVLLLVLAGVVAVLVVVGAQLRCVDAAREGARAAARGDDAARVTAVVARAGPSGAVARIAPGATEVRVTVSADVAPLGAVPLHVRVSAGAVAAREPGSVAAPASDGAPG